MIAHFIFLPHKNASKKHFEKGRKFALQKGLTEVKNMVS